MKYLMILFLLLLPACSTLTPAQRQGAIATVEQEYLHGNITQAQRDAAIEAIRSDQPFDWEGLGIFGVNILLALIGGPMIVRQMRGPPTQRVGLPESKIVKPG